MKTLRLVLASCLNIVPMCAPAGGATTQEGSAAETMVVQPERDESLLINPGKGWVEYNGPSAYTNDVIGLEYTRTTWAALEPEEGKHAWQRFDTFLDFWSQRGKRCAFGVINFDGGMGKQYSIPKWVFDAGAEALAVPDGSTPTGTLILPKTWDDPVYLAKMKRFIAAFGERYDGNPSLAFLDIRDYGNSGECNGDYHDIRNTSLDSFRDNYLLPYVQAFRATRLMLPWTAAWFGGKPADPVYAWAVAQGVGIRRDGICSHWSKDGSECLLAYGHAPAVFEYASGWADTVKEGYASPETLMGYVNAGKPSYVQFHAEFYEANRDFCRMLGNKMGYHFILQQARIPKSVGRGATFPLELTWLNDGVAPLYEPCRVAIALLDQNNNVIERQWLAGSNPQGWLPNVSTTERFRMSFQALPPTGYKLALGLFLRESDPFPTYRLGIRGRLNTGWYVLKGSTDSAPASWTNVTGGSWRRAENWAGSSYRDGVDAIADFGKRKLPSDSSVTLDGDATVGTLVFGDVGASHNWLLTKGSGGALTLRVSSGAPRITVTDQSATLDAAVNTFQGLVKDGAGTLVLQGPVGMHGDTRITAGVLEVAASTKLYSTWQNASVVVSPGATLRVNGWGGYGNGGWGEIDQTPMDDAKALLLDGGTLEFVGANAGNSSRALGIGSHGATLMDSSAKGWCLSATGADAQSTVTDNSLLTLSGTGTNSQLQKRIVGSGGLDKRGAGTWTLTGASTYEGATLVSQGTLQILGSLAGRGAVTVAAGGTLRGVGAIGGPLTVLGTLAPGTEAIGALAASGDVVLKGTVAVRLWKLDAACANDAVRGIGSLTYGGALVVTQVGGPAPAAGDAFVLFGARTYAGRFARIALPELGAGLRWDGSNLATDGSVRVVQALR